MSTATKPRAPRRQAAVKASEAAIREQEATAKVEATQAAQAAKVAAEEAAVEAEKPAGPSLSDRQFRLVTDYRNADRDAAIAKHAANVIAVAYFRTLPETITVTTAKSNTTKPVSARERAEKTLEALCVHVERNANGKVTKGLDTIGFTVQRVTQMVEAFRNAEVALSTLRVEEHAAALADTDPTTVAATVVEAKQVEALVSKLDQARVEGGTKAAAALASSIREQVEEEVAANGADENAPAPVAVAVEAATDGVDAIREGKREQRKETPKVKTASQIVGDAVAALVSALEAEAQNLDAGQKSALLAKVEAATLFLK